MPAPTAPSPGFGEHLRKRRLAHNMTQEEAAAAVGVTQPTWSGWESGEQMPQGRRLEELERTLGVDTGVWLAAHMERGGGSSSHSTWNVQRATHLREHDLPRPTSALAEAPVAA